MRFTAFLTQIDEAFDGYKKITPSSEGEDNIDLNPGKEDDVDLNPGEGEDNIDLNPDEEGDGEVDNIAKDIVSKASEDPDRQGLIRTVPRAHLIYKREQEDGTFEELWIYNVGNFKTDIETKKAILAGTDIPPNKTQSADGSQECKVWSIGNAEVISITGLPN